MIDILKLFLGKIMKARGDWIETYTGKKFYPLKPTPKMVCIEDIAHSLSHICRFNGHSKKFYSVAEHSVLMCDAAKKLGYDKSAQLVILLHDAHEAYIGDITRPLKRSINQRSGFVYCEFLKIVDKLDSVIFKTFGISKDDLEKNRMHVTWFDNAILVTEKKTLFPNSKNKWFETGIELKTNIWCLSPLEIEKHFLERFNQLTNE